MDNPWEELICESGEWLLARDREAIRGFNSKQANSKHRICLESIPEPFIGNPRTARIVFLGLNPGHSEKDIEEHRGEAFRNAILRNLRHETQEYPFYPLNPKFRKTGAGQWWTARLRYLKEACRLEECELSQRVMAIEWFPYHSEKSGLPGKQICASQDYSRFLAKQMLQREDVQVLGMRARKRWLPWGSEFNDVPFVNSVQNPAITRNNVGESLFERILKLLQQGAEQYSTGATVCI